MALTTETREQLLEIVARYPQPRSALLPMLHLVQAEEGYVTPDGIQLCADVLDIATAEVAAVATFYTMYKRRPVGDYHVGVCTNTLCAVMGGDAIFGALKEHLGVGNDETTEDGRVTLEHIECNAACDFAPVMTVNWEFVDNATVESAKQLVDDLRSGRARLVHARAASSGRSARSSGCSPGSPTGSPTRASPPVRRPSPAWRSLTSSGRRHPATSPRGRRSPTVARGNTRHPRRWR